MLRLQDIRIPVRIAAACLLPMLAFTGFAVMEMASSRATVQEAATVASLLEIAPATSALESELQEERGITIGFVNSDGANFASELREQWPKTDKVFAAWLEQVERTDRTQLSAAGRQSLDTAIADWKKIEEIREQAYTFQSTVEQVQERYAASIGHLLALVESIGELAKDVRVLHAVEARTAVARRKELAGQERALGATGFGSVHFIQGVHRGFIEAVAMQRVQTEIFEANASQEEIAFLRSRLTGPLMDELARMRNAAAASPFDPNVLRTVNAAQWRDTSVRYMQELEAVESHMTDSVMRTVETVAGEARRHFWTIVGIFVTLLAVTGALSYFIARSITRPLADLGATMGALADNRSDVDVPGTDRKDELGNMAKAVLVFRDAAVEKTRLEAEAEKQRQAAEEERNHTAEVQAQAAEEQAQVVRALAAGLKKLSEGDLTHRLDEGFTDSYLQIRDDFNETMERLQGTMRSIIASMREVTNAASEIAASTTDLSQRTEEQAASLEETSASVEEIAATVRKNAENAQEASRFAVESREVADRGGGVIGAAVTSMGRIEESSRKISEITGVIDEIAFQTNLLALNAAVEAARAGEAGRGFAVVAAEVRSLAQRTSEAARDIKSLILSSTGQVEEGVELVNRAGEALTEIVGSIKKVADLVSDIATASAEQAAGIDQVNTVLSQMDEATQQNSALVEENAASVKTLEQQAQEMDDRIRFFRVGGDDAGPPIVRPGTLRAQDEREAEAQSAKVVTVPANRTTGAKAGSRRLVGRMQAALATAFKQDPDWKEF